MNRIDSYLPVYDVSDAVAVVLDAKREAVWKALNSVDLIELGRKHPMVGALGALRISPELVLNLLRGDGLPDQPDHMTLRETTDDGDWVLLEDRSNEELILGLVGKFWRPVIEYAKVTPEEFAGFDQPGFAKTVYALSLTHIPGGRTLLRGEMRTATNDSVSRRRFRRYWNFGVGSGAHILVQALLDQVREMVEEDTRKKAVSR